MITNLLKFLLINRVDVPISHLALSFEFYSEIKKEHLDSSQFSEWVQVYLVIMSNASYLL